MSNKSEATWHPNSAPEAPHADLIARLRAQADYQREVGPTKHIMLAAADALAALGDTVPREQYDQMRADRFSEGWTAAHAHFTPRITTAERERAEARAERDALAHVVERVRAAHVADVDDSEVTWRIGGILETAPAVSLALHNAEVWDEGFEEGAGVGHTGEHNEDGLNPYRAAAIREEAK